MPPTYSIWNTTNIILVDGNFNMVRGNFRHLDRSLSTIITNPDPFNETTTSPSLAPTLPVPPNTSAERPDYDTDRPTSNSEGSYQQPVSVALSAQSTMDTSYLDDEHSPPLHQSSTETSEPQLSLSSQMNKLRSIRKRIKDRLKRAFDHLRPQQG